MARALAALYVVMHHVFVTRKVALPAHLGLLLRLGQEAVIVFFLLRGFVIFSNEEQRALHPRGYYLRRLRKIYPLLVVAGLTSAAVLLVDGRLAQDFHSRELLATVLALQDVGDLKPGVIANPFLGNQPLWSLSYEIAFYAIFPLILKMWNRSPRVTSHLVGGHFRRPQSDGLRLSTSNTDD